MNIRGLVIEKQLVKSLYDYKTRWTIDLLKSLDVFDSYDWKNFKKEEFINILDGLNILFEKFAFPEKQKFIFFYETDVTEMDVVAVIEYRNSPLFIDIEIKNGEKHEELIDNVKNQFLKREENFLPQLFKDSKYLEIGLVNNQICIIKHNDGKRLNEIDEQQLKIILSNSSFYSKYESFLYQVNNLSSIISISSQIRDGSFKYYKDTLSIAESFKEKLCNDNHFKGIVCYGNAGTGKSVLALKLFYEIENSKILILNPKFYFCLNMSTYWKDGRAAYKVEDILSNLNDEDILIVDEAQRLREEQISLLALNCKKIIFFGDEKQSFKLTENIFNINEMKKHLEKLGLGRFHKRNLSSSKRYSDKVSQLISNLTSKDPVDVYAVKDFEINLFYNEEDFETAYCNKSGLKKIYVPYTQQHTGNIKINNKIYELADFKENGFSIEKAFENKVGHTLHALSFDVEHSFVFLSNISLYKYKNSQDEPSHSYIYYGTRPTQINTILKFMNELNILFSRGRKSLNIYVDNILVYLYLKGRLPSKK